MKTFAILTLGCKVNAFESEWYIQQLENQGLQHVDFKESADVYIINTCAVTNVAEAKSRQKLHAAIKRNKDAVICVVGCYVQAVYNENNEIAADIVIGTAGKKKLPELILNYSKTSSKTIEGSNNLEGIFIDDMVLKQFNQHRAYLKIQDGCNQYCSYCIIPFVRGQERSLGIDKVIENAKNLAIKHKELVLTGIHTGRYNDGNNDLAVLLRTILKEVPELTRLRISSIEITEITDEIIDLLRNESKIAKHLHIPLQAGSDEVLKLMNRPYTKEYFRKRIAYIKEMCPNVSISTDVIVGFPGETDELFEETENFIKETGFSFLHVFPYSKKRGTKAEKIVAQINSEHKKMRVQSLTMLSKNMYNVFKQNLINNQVEVFFESFSNNVLRGYCSEYVNIYVRSSEDLTNEMVKVLVTHFEDGELWGEIKGE